MQDEKNRNAQEMTQEAQEAPAAESIAATEAADAAGTTPDAEQKLAQAETRLAELQDAFLRAKAESENMRRRAQEDIAKAHKFAVESFAESMVPVKDSLEMA